MIAGSELLFRKARFQDRTKPVIFLLPHAGAGGSAYLGWGSELAPEIESSVLQLPGRENRFREKPYAYHAELVRDAAEVILAGLGPTQPFALFGNSFGAHTAFEVAHRIRERTGREPVHLYVAAARAAHLNSPLGPISDLPESEFAQQISERYDGIPASVRHDPEFLAAVLPALRSDFRLMETREVISRKPFRCRLTAFGGRFDKTISKDEICAWKVHTTGSFHCSLLDRGHLFLQTERTFLTTYVRSTLVSNESLSNS